MQRKMKRISAGLDKRAAKARMLYRRIEAGAREQRRIQRIFERKFFLPEFKPGQLVKEAGKFRGSRRQEIELKEYAKRLARKRKWALNKFRAWGLKPRHMGKPMEKTPSGVSAKRILFNMTGWHGLDGKVKMVPAIDMLAFIVEPETYAEINKKEFPKTGKAPCFAIGGAEGTIDVMFSSNIQDVKKYIGHERSHAASWEMPMTQELRYARTQRINPRAQTQSFVPTNLRIGAKKIGRTLLDELIANMLEERIGYFEKRYKTYYLTDYSREWLGPKTAASFMRNKGNYKARTLKAAEESIKAVRKALAASVSGSNHESVKIVGREEVAALLRNIRDIEKVPKRLPVLIELRKKKLEKRTAGKGVTQ